MWSGPRNLSTALMRSFENRTDTAVIDEPFYAHFLKQTNSEPDVWLSGVNAFILGTDKFGFRYIAILDRCCSLRIQLKTNNSEP